ncbi:hypothetical protein MW887_005636 [Aspergillus wentii]|nr:hypothetical protein MW887_005636 [Aspergillus wentii]
MSSFPAFFEQIMLPDLPGVNETQDPQQPRDVFDFMQDADFTFSDIDLFGNNFIPDLDMILDPQVHIQDDGSGPDLIVDSVGSARLRVEAFQRSLWLWIPEKNQNAFSEEGRIPLRDTDMTTAISSSHRTPLDNLKIQGKLTNRARDDMFQLVVRTAGSRLLVSAFPAAEHLDTLIKIGIAKKTETDSWIHPYTLYNQDLRPELLTAMVAAGCVEYDNSVLRDLQYLQASMMWLDIGVFCGYKRKMQIAESYLQPLCTALRRAGTFDCSAYSAITPFSCLDNEESLEDIWHTWVKQESLKRLVYHLFEHDIQVATAMNRPAITCYAELTLPFPAHRDLWLAPTATAWKNLYIEMYGRHIRTSELSLRDVLADPSLLNHPPSDVDAGIATLALLHGLASQVWEFRQQVLLSRCCVSGSRAMNRLWLQSRQDDIYSILQGFQGDLFSASAVATLLKEFTMMYLHIDVDAIQRFAGKLGELDAKRAYPGLRDWSQTKEARIAIWHAGQVFRTARLVPPYQLRGFDCLAIYHAALTLWVYGLLQCGENRHVEVNTPVTVVDGAIFVCIDGPECQLTKAFVARNIGQPGLTFDTIPGGHDSASHQGFCELSKPRSIMVIARQIFESNYPGASPADNLPPLVSNLRNLMQDLGDLP